MVWADSICELTPARERKPAPYRHHGLSPLTAFTGRSTDVAQLRAYYSGHDRALSSVGLRQRPATPAGKPSCCATMAHRDRSTGDNVHRQVYQEWGKILRA